MRSVLRWLGLLTLSCSTAFANCGSDQSTCTASCVVGAAMTKQFGGGNQCTMDCLSAANACEAREAQQRQMEEQRQQAQQLQRQQAAERQAQQARDAKEIAGNRQNIQKAGEIAQRVGAEAAIQQQFDTAMEKGMNAIDQKGYVSAEFQFKAALKIKPNDLDAKAGLLRSIVGAGRRSTALTYANEQLLRLASLPPNVDGHSAYSSWLEVLFDNGLVGETERGQLERIYPFGEGDPVGAATAFPKNNPKSSFLTFVTQLSRILPAILADLADRHREAEIKLQAAALAKAKAKAKADAAAKLQAETADVEYKAWHILVMNESEARDIIARLKMNPRAFEALAKEKSKDSGSKEKGGDLGWFDPRRMVPEFSDAVTKLAKGQFTEDPVKSQWGYHVIFLEDSRQKAGPSF